MVAVCVHAAVDARPDAVAGDERIDVLLRGLCVRRAVTASYKFLLIRCYGRRFEGPQGAKFINLDVYRDKWNTLLVGEVISQRGRRLPTRAVTSPRSALF